MLCRFKLLQTAQMREADDRLTPEETAKLALYFCFLWFAANWTLNAALAYTSVASATVLSSMSGMGLFVHQPASNSHAGIFTLAIGRIFRVETLTLIKIGAVFTRYAAASVCSHFSNLLEQASEVLS